MKRKKLILCLLLIIVGITAVAGYITFKFFVDEDDFDYVPYKRVYLPAHVTQEYCEKVEGVIDNDDYYTSAKDECFLDLVVKEGNTDIDNCNRIKAWGMRGTCISALATKAKDVKMCDEIPTLFSGPDGARLERSIRANCISGIAQQTKDLSLCQRITDDYFKEKCLRPFATPEVPKCSMNGYVDESKYLANISIESGKEVTAFAGEISTTASDWTVNVVHSGVGSWKIADLPPGMKNGQCVIVVYSNESGPDTYLVSPYTVVKQ